MGHQAEYFEVEPTKCELGDVIQHLSTGKLYYITGFAVDKVSANVDSFDNLFPENIEGLPAIHLGLQFDFFFRLLPNEEVAQMKCKRILGL